LLPSVRLRPVLIRKAFYMLVLAWMMLASTVPSFGGPVELLQNGDFRDGLREWKIEGVAFLDAEGVKILREGLLSQTVRRPDLSFYLELSYSVRKELPSNAYFARSVITFYTNDSKGKGLNFTVIGQTHGELGISSWKDIKLNLFQLFKSSAADPESFHLTALKVTLELGFTVSVPPPAVAYFRNISLKRANPTKILIQESGQKVLSDRTELAISVTNVGDIDASNLIATLNLPSDTVIISEKTSFSRETLEGGARWILNWMLISKSSGMHPVTVRVVSDQGEVELSLRLSIGGIPPGMTTETVTTTMRTTVEKIADQVIVMFSQAAFIVFVVFLIIVIIIPMIRGRRTVEVVYRLGTVRCH